MSKEFGFIRHFRECRPNQMAMCKNMRRIVDTSVSDWAEGFRDNVMNVRRKVFGSK